jgi:hypothetical protein
MGDTDEGEEKANKCNGMGQNLAGRLLPRWVEEPGEKPIGVGRVRQRGWANRKQLERQGLEAYQCEPGSAHFGTGSQRLEKGRKWALPGGSRDPSHGTSIALCASNIVFDSQ